MKKTLGPPPLSRYFPRYFLSTSTAGFVVCLHGFFSLFVFVVGFVLFLDFHKIFQLIGIFLLVKDCLNIMCIYFLKYLIMF